MAASEKRCHYEVLGLSRDCSPDEIRAAYKKLALQRHPDKLIKSGLSQSEATAQFQELSQAYEILSDPKERAWYDSHRSQILFSNPNDVSSSVIPNFKIYANEVSFCKKLGLGLENNVREMPLMGNLESPYEQVTAFYNYWLGFVTVMDFCWVDQYDVMAGVNRKSRRVMEEENKKLRKKARREYNETVRGLAEFVKKRDKRVIDMMVKKNTEMEKRKEEERERKKKLERERIERARAYEEPEWARVNEEDVEDIEEFHEEEMENKKGNGGKELYCVVCGKKFKSEKQWKNHEQSKKHKEKVAELRESFESEDENDGYFDGVEEDNHEHNVDEVEERFKDGVRITDEENGVENPELINKEDGFFDAEDFDEMEGSNVEDGNGDEDDVEDGDAEMSILEAMVTGHKSRKSRKARHLGEHFPTEVHVDDVNEEPNVTEYNNRKTRRRKGKKDRGKSDGRVPARGDFDEKSPDDKIEGLDDKRTEEFSSHSFVENENDGNINDHLRKNHRSDQPVDNQRAKKKESNTKSNNSSKGKKGKWYLNIVYGIWISLQWHVL
ncbi:conserved hypothetical protein [Ricinus communis]|uniref:J domain-containing protein n=1 Tax=Ricinus communis TaxID=3988 RepID=B9RLP0_RICCO|nr:conserved hypothetical protein [Ricinus communis]